MGRLGGQPSCPQDCQNALGPSFSFSAYSPLLSWHHHNYHDGSDCGENKNCDYHYSSEDKRMKRMTPKHTIWPSWTVTDDDNDNEDVVDEDGAEDDDAEDGDDKKYL